MIRATQAISTVEISFERGWPAGTTRAGHHAAQRAVSHAPRPAFATRRAFRGQPAMGLQPARNGLALRTRHGRVAEWQTHGT